MKKYVEPLLLLSIVPVLLLLGCAKAPAADTTAKKPTIQKSGDEPVFEVAGFHLLSGATLETELPYILTGDSTPLETPCLERSKKATQWNTANRDVQKNMEAAAASLPSIVATWFERELSLSVASSDVSKWQIALDSEDLIIRHFATENVRFAAEQQCITAQVRTLPVDQKVVTTLFGTTEFTIVSQTPIDADLIKDMRAAAKKKKLQFNTVTTYKKAKDEKGRPIFKKGKPMFEAPDGTLVPKKQVPPMKKRPVYEVIISAPKGLFLAYGDMPQTHFESENNPASCKINLIFDDMTPRIPECSQMKDLGLGVAMAESPDEVIVKLATTEATGEQSIPYDQVGFVQAGGTGFAWVTPRRLEEGAVLEVDSLVLHPTDAKSESLTPFTYGQ
ncbi:MAG: hypothetical protein JXX29_22590 [Deltaproteobacteria bacterium]|nr:hypothetical protein [Deltaproteobacteria bacterium]MBN2674486.1 hypothetical protein [Deltaproteobacteria bacterium]